MLLGPVIVFTTARVTGYTLFTQRYLIYALLPCFILIAWALRQVQNQRARFAVLCGLSLNAFVYVFTLGGPDWRIPLEAAERMVSSDTPLLIQCGFAESTQIDLRGEPKATSYLFAPLTVYPVRNQVMIPVPFALTPATERLVTEAVEQNALHHRKFALLSIDGTNAEPRLSAWLKQQGYRSTVRRVSGYTLLLLEKPS